MGKAQGKAQGNDNGNDASFTGGELRSHPGSGRRSTSSAKTATQGPTKGYASPSAPRTNALRSHGKPKSAPAGAGKKKAAPPNKSKSAKQQRGKPKYVAPPSPEELRKNRGQMAALHFELEMEKKKLAKANPGRKPPERVIPKHQQKILDEFAREKRAGSTRKKKKKKTY